jgi:hypothetical protein
LQEEMLSKILDLEKLYIKTLERIEDLDKNHDITLQSILKIDEKVKRMLEKKENLKDSL